MNNTQIVLIGGGYTTLWAYRSLIKELRREISRGEVRILVVCPEDHHFFHGWTAESLTAIVRNENRMTPLASVLPEAQLVKGYACEIDSASQDVYVKTEDGIHPVHYDHLVIGIGLQDSQQIAGLNRHGYQIKSDASFLRTQKHIQSLVLRAAQLNRADAERLLHFTVCGAGFTGVELVTNLAEFLAVLIRQYPSLLHVRPTIRLLHSKETILDALHPNMKRMKRYAEKVLGQYGIEVICGKRVREISADGAFLDDNSFLPSAMVISTIGQKRVPLKGTEDMKCDNLGRLYTNRFLQLEGYANVWGGGDACAVPYRSSKNSCVPNALWAIKHGTCAGGNIGKAIRQKSLKPFNFKGLGQCASLGIGKGIGELYGIEFTGWIAWIMRWFFFNYFMPSRSVMVNEIGDWMHLLWVGKRRGLKVQEPLKPSVNCAGLGEGRYWPIPVGSQQTLNQK